MIKYRSKDYDIDSFIRYIVNDTSLNEYVQLFDNVFFKKFFEAKRRIKGENKRAFSVIGETVSYSEFYSENLKIIKNSLIRLGLIIEHNKLINKDTLSLSEYLNEFKEKKEFIENLSWDMLLDIEREEEQEIKLEEVISEKATDKVVSVIVGFNEGIFNSYDPSKFRADIFTSENAHKFFDYLTKEIDSKSNYLSDLSYIFRQMEYDGFIYKNLRHKPYFEFLVENYDLSIGKIKQYSQVSSSKRIQNYNYKKQLFKLHSS